MYDECKYDLTLLVSCHWYTSNGLGKSSRLFVIIFVSYYLVLTFERLFWQFGARQIWCCSKQLWAVRWWLHRVYLFDLMRFNTLELKGQRCLVTIPKNLSDSESLTKLQHLFFFLVKGLLPFLLARTAAQHNRHNAQFRKARSSDDKADLTQRLSRRSPYKSKLPYSR